MTNQKKFIDLDFKDSFEFLSLSFDLFMILPLLPDHKM